jgi:hypothetical protein
MCIVEVLAAGPQAVERRNSVMKALASLLLAAADELKDGPRPPALTAEAIVGGIYEVVYSRVLRGRTAELPDELQQDLAYSTMLPYIGHAAARREAAKAANVEVSTHSKQMCVCNRALDGLLGRETWIFPEETRIFPDDT